MTNVFYFSDYISPFIQRIKFICIIVGRFFTILFHIKKDIKLLHFSYANKYQFDNAYVVIRYQFKNALWYNFKHIKRTTAKEIIVLNLKNVPEMPIKLVVYGFFRKKNIPISVAVEQTLEGKLFGAELKNVKDARCFVHPVILNSSMAINIPIKTQHIPSVGLLHPNIKINYPLFSQIDFI